MSDILRIVISGASILFITYLVGIASRKYLKKLDINKVNEKEHPILEGIITHSKFWGRYGIGACGLIVIVILVSRFTDINSGTMEDAYIFSGILLIITIITIPISYRFKVKFNREYIDVRTSYGFKFKRILYKNISIDPSIEFLILTNDITKKTYMMAYTEKGVQSLDMSIRKVHRKTGKSISSVTKLSKFYKPLLGVILFCSLFIFSVGLINLFFDDDFTFYIIFSIIGFIMLLVSTWAYLYYLNTSINQIEDKIIFTSIFGKEKMYPVIDLNYSNRKYGVIVYYKDSKVFKSYGKGTTISFMIENAIKHR